MKSSHVWLVNNVLGGGRAEGNGFVIDWGRADAREVLEAVVDRLREEQKSSSACVETSEAIDKVDLMRGWLNRRAMDREFKKPQ